MIISYGPKVVSRHRVPSNSTPGKSYEVLLLEDGSMTCDCYAGSYKAECRHKRRTRNDIGGLKYDSEIY